VTGFAPVHTPDEHVSVCVQALPSLQLVPFGAAGLLHVPLEGSHVPATWHASLAAHVTGFEPMHTPVASHTSVCVHPFPSLHVPPVRTGFEQIPVAVLHVPALWHWSRAVHVTGFAPVHVPAWHESLCVHALPSSQLVPFARDGLLHVPVLGSHVPAAWH
jgi:hypothetical protein